MTIQFSCPTCGRSIRVRDEAAGQKGKCQDCGNTIQVPAAPLAAPRVESSSVSTSQKRRPDRPSTAMPPEGEATSGGKGKPSGAVPPRGKKEKSNNWARSAFGAAIVALLVSWIAAINYVAIGLVLIALGLTVFAFVLSFRRQGNGRLLTIASAVIACVAIPVIVVTTQMEKERKQLVGSIQAQVRAIDAFRERQFSTTPPAKSPAAPQPGASSTGTAPPNGGVASNTKEPETPPAAAAQSAEPIPPNSNGSSADSPKRPQTVTSGISPSDTDSPATKRPAKKPSDTMAMKRAQRMLDQGRRFAKTRNVRGAERAFRRVIETAPGTPLAAEAQRELDALESR